MASLNAYPKLPDRRSIRVIQLHGVACPDEEEEADNDAICFDLVTVSLDATPPPSYEALSYTWSGQSPDRVVYANGRQFLVTRNAEAAMRRLRSRGQGPGARLCLWIDAICINQQDAEEKGTQVEMMVEIYANARRVNIWLGEGNEASNFALKWLRRLGSPVLPMWSLWRMFFAALPRVEKDIRLRSLFLLALLLYWLLHFLWCAVILVGLGLMTVLRLLPMLKDFKRKLRVGLIDLMSREYWERAWTTQEAALSRSCFVFCGSSAPLRIEAFAPAQVMLAHFCSFDIEYVYSIYRLHLTPYTLEVEEGLESLCTKKATLAVDKIYAVRAVFAGTLGSLPVDYSRPAGDVYTDAARLILERHRSVKFFRFACQNGRPDGFPTWVPAWNTPTTTPEKLCKSAPSMLSRYPVVSQDVDKRVLKLKGLRVDIATADISSQFPISPPQDSLAATGDAFAVFQAWVEASPDWDRMKQKLDQSASLLARIYNLKPDKVRSWLPSICLEYDYGIKPQSNSRTSLTDAHYARIFTAEFLKLVSGRFLFASEGGKVVMSTLAVREGDEIVMLTGEQLPYVIRRCPGQPGKYTLVSPCWISGAVNGEAWPSLWKGRGSFFEDLDYFELV
ncbi:hypothetical protein Hte_003041 [Hypoxylon texense]